LEQVPLETSTNTYNKTFADYLISFFFTPDQFAAKLRVNKNEIEYPCWSC